MALLKICRCSKLIPLGSKCECRKGRHKDYDKYKRDQKAKDFYNSKEWKIIREKVLFRDNYLCVKCLQQDIRSADMVDHIIPIKINWSLRLDLYNLQSLCNKCHSVKTREDKLKYRR